MYVVQIFQSGELSAAALWEFDLDGRFDLESSDGFAVV